MNKYRIIKRADMYVIQIKGDRSWDTWEDADYTGNPHFDLGAARLALRQLIAKDNTQPFTVIEGEPDDS